MTMIELEGRGIEPLAAPADDSRVVVISEDSLLRRGLRLLLGDAGMRVYDVESIERARRLCSPEASDRSEVVLWVVDRLDDEIEIDADQLLASGSLGLCVLAASVQVEAVRRLLTNHAQRLGILLRRPDLDPSKLVACVGEVLAGGLSIEPGLVSRVLRREVTRESRFTPIEQAVLELLTAGWRNREIARRLHRSEKSIENHISRVFSKLGLDSTLHAGIDRRVTAALLHAGERRIELAFHAATGSSRLAG